MKVICKYDSELDNFLKKGSSLHAEKIWKQLEFIKVGNYRIKGH